MSVETVSHGRVGAGPTGLEVCYAAEGDEKIRLELVLESEPVA